MRETQLEQELQAVVDWRAPAALNRWALVRYRKGRGRRLSACLFDTKADAEENADPDEVLVRVRVLIERVYR